MWKQQHTLNRDGLSNKQQWKSLNNMQHSTFSISFKNLTLHFFRVSISINSISKRKITAPIQWIVWLFIPGNYRELIEYLNGTSDLLAKNGNILDNVLETLDVQQHSLGVLYVLVAKFTNLSVCWWLWIYCGIFFCFDTCISLNIHAHTNNGTIHKYSLSIHSSNLELIDWRWKCHSIGARIHTIV